MAKDLIYPIDTANFKWIRENGFVYVDKTRYIHTLTKNKGKYYFLARPRRFGKSLFLDTLAEYFGGNRRLFKGLEIDTLIPDPWDSYPVLRFNLSAQAYQDKDTLYDHLASKIREYEEEFNLPTSNSTVPDRFDKLIRSLANASGKRVVVLIDEYDSPLTSTIDLPDIQNHYREQLHGFYSVLKNSEPHIHFCFLTGVTRYGKVSVFSGLNNLNDITFDNEYAGICGITERELIENYDNGVEKLAGKFKTTKEEIYKRLKDEYDGYHFSASLLDVYNPYSINHVFDKEKFQDYWCKSGVPTILSKSLMQNDFDVEGLNGKKVPEGALADLSMFTADPIPLFYQTGYLTIKAYEERRHRYTLGYPNREVESAVMRDILKVYMNTQDDRQGMIYDMEDSLEEGDARKFLKLLAAFLSDIPNQLHKYVDRYENYYHTIFYCLASLIGLDVEAEYSTSEGFIDLLIKTKDYIYIIELKVNGSAEDAMAQIENKHYGSPFGADSRKLIRIGIGFSTATHSIDSFIIN